MSLVSGVASIECKFVETVFGFIWLNSVGRLSRSCVDFVPDVRVFGIFLFFLRGVTSRMPSDSGDAMCFIFFHLCT